MLVQHPDWGGVLTETYRVGIIGLGRMASTIDDEVREYAAVTLPYSIAAACAASDRLELVCGADLVPEKRAAFRERWGVSALYDDYRQMIAAEAPDLVAITTRGVSHAEIAVQVIEAGVRRIYLEKAMGCSMAEADAVLAACRRHDVALNTGVLRRFDVRYQNARRLVQQGEIGEVTQAIHYGATNLLHGHIHSIDTLMYLLGDPRPCSVWGELRGSDLEFHQDRLDRDPAGVYRIRFENDAEAWTIPAGNWEFELIGSSGVIRGMNNGIDWSWRKADPRAGRRTSFREQPFPEVPPFSATRCALEDLVRAIEEGRLTLGNVEVAHQATECCFAVAESHLRGGTRVDLPLQNRQRYVFHV
jgi:predicted dehydrogenase